MGSPKKEGSLIVELLTCFKNKKGRRKFSIKDQKKTKEKRNFPIKDRKKTKEKKKKFPIKDRKKTKKKKKIPNQRSEENKRNV